MLTTRTFIQTADALIANVSGAVVAPAEVIQLSVVSLLSGGHLLLNDLPGMGKTLLARSLAYSIEGSFKRIQFTPDLLPTDITGSSIYNQGASQFDFIPGPVFANVVLADEINRASTRTQSALLEAMAESQVTVDGHSYPLPDPFWVVATQNEVDGYGTFPLPQAQLDRFIISLTIGYPDPAEQVTILERNRMGDPVVEPVLTISHIRDMQAQVREIEVARPVREYLSSILAATRSHPQIELGASPRSGVQLQIAAQALAALRGDSFVTPEHIKAVALPVLRHRIIPAPSATLSVEDAISETIQSIPVPF
ncbi:MAG: AAA family ATPase [Chloroflexi bacterium]|nr:AAA family ATPase [Chloroflexota bacterium]